MDETVEQCFSQARLDDLAARRERPGEVSAAEVEAGWRELLPQVGAAIEAAMDPAAPEAQSMAERWSQLLEAFHGGDDGLRESLYRLQAENAEQIEQEHGGPSTEQLDFIARADAARA